MAPVSLILFALFPAVIIVAALRDLTSFTIPNWVSLAAAASFVPAALCGASRDGRPGPVPRRRPHSPRLRDRHVLVRLDRAGAMRNCSPRAPYGSAGPRVAPFMIYTSLAGGLLAVGLLWARNMAPRQLVLAARPWAQRLMRPNGDVPYGLAIAAGGVDGLSRQRASARLIKPPHAASF